MSEEKKEDVQARACEGEGASEAAATGQAAGVSEGASAAERAAVPAAPKPACAPKPAAPKRAAASAFIRAANEDDDGYDPYSDRPARKEPLFERDPWS